MSFFSANRVVLAHWSLPRAMPEVDTGHLSSARCGLRLTRMARVPEDARALPPSRPITEKALDILECEEAFENSELSFSAFLRKPGTAGA